MSETGLAGFTGPAGHVLTPFPAAPPLMRRELPGDVATVPVQVDLAAEAAVLGSAMMSSAALADCAEKLKPTDFYQPAHELLWQTMLDMAAVGKPVDLTTLAAELAGAGRLGRAGGHGYLARLVAEPVTAANAGFYAGIVIERAQRRALQEAATRMNQLSQAADGTATAELVSQAQAWVMALTDRADGGYGSHIAQIIDDQGALDDLAEAARRPVPTGLAGLDGLVDGWMPGQLILLAARPAVGKSAMALQLARAAAEARIGTLLFTLEMTSRETLQRMAAATANVPLTAVKRGSMDAGQSEAVSRAETALRELPLWVDDSTSATIMSLRAKCRHHQQRNHVGLVVVDYLQLMGSASGGRDANRQQEVADISRGLKLMAKELAIPVIALSQLNRVSESRADKRPQLSDLRDSGALEQDADVVMLLHDKTKPDMPSGGDIMWTGPGQGFAAKPFREVDLIVAKQRSGPSGSVPLVFDGSKMRFGPRIDADAYPA